MTTVLGQTNYQLGVGISDMTGLVSEGALVSVMSKLMSDVQISALKICAFFSSAAICVSQRLRIKAK